MSKKQKRKSSQERSRVLPPFLHARGAETRQFHKLLLILFVIYCLSFSTVPFTDTDDQLMLTSAAGFLEMGKFVAPSRFATKDFGGFQFGKASESGEVYSKYPFGYPLILVPFVLLAGLLNQAFGAVAAEVVLSFPSLLLLMATSLLVWRSALRLDFGAWAARLLVLAFGLGSFAWGYVGTNYSEPAQAFMAAAAFYCLLAARQEPDFWKPYALLGGLALGYGILVRPLFAILAPLLVSAAFWGWVKSFPFRTALLRTALYALPGLVSSCYLLATNLVLFGSATDFGYGNESFDTPLSEGFIGLLIGSHKGILWYFPLCIVLPFGAWKLRQRNQPWAAIVLSAAVLIQLTIVSKWWGWSGGWAWGPRLLMPILPFAVLLAGGIISSLSWRRTATVLVIAGIAINSLGIVINRMAYQIIRHDAELPAPVRIADAGNLPGHIWLLRFALSDIFSGNAFETPVWKSPPWIGTFPQGVPAPYRNQQHPIWNPWPIRLLLPDSVWRRGEKGYMRSLLELAVMRYEQGEMQRALKLLDRGLTMDGRSAEFSAAKGMVYLSSANPREALKYFDQAIRFDPAYELGYYGRALLMEAAGNHAAARQAYNQLLQTPEGSLDRRVIQERLQKLER
jgi:4-amino-4-deoxy-L-arabinose transferase-like glycosyltransferase